MKTKRNVTMRRAKKADLAVRQGRTHDVKGGIIIIGGVPQLGATVNPLTIRALNPQPLPPRW